MRRGGHHTFPPTVHLLYLFWHDSLSTSLLEAGRRLFHRWDRSYSRNATQGHNPKAVVYHRGGGGGKGAK
jgi:hypothetical protein